MFKDEEALTRKQQQLVAKYYEDAVRIGNSLKSSVLHDDEKENIAVAGLIKAAKKFDENNKKNASFNTYLYMVIRDLFLNGDKGPFNKKANQYLLQRKRVPKNKLILESVLEGSGEYSVFASMFPQYDTMNELEHGQLLTAIRSRLTDRQRFIFDAMLDPESAGITSKVTMQALAPKLGITKQWVNKEVLVIRDVVERVMKCMDSPYFRINPKEKQNG